MHVKPKSVIRPLGDYWCFIFKLSAVFLFFIGVLPSFFLDIARYACEKTYVNTLNIKQKYNQILMPDLG